MGEMGGGVEKTILKGKAMELESEIKKSTPETKAKKERKKNKNYK